MLKIASDPVRRGLASAALTAFKVAEVQQRRFERTLHEVNSRQESVQAQQERAADSHEKKVDEQRRAAEAQRVAKSGDGSNGAQTRSSDAEPQSTAGASAGQRGGAVDLEV